MNADSVKARLKNFAVESGHTFQEALVYYGLERTTTDDAFIFDLDSIIVEDITEFKKYHGPHVSAVGYLDRTRIPVSMDLSEKEKGNDSPDTFLFKDIKRP